MGTPSWWSTVTSRGEAHVADLNGCRKHAHVRRYFWCTLSTTQTLAMEQTFEHDHISFIQALRRGQTPPMRTASTPRHALRFIRKRTRTVDTPATMLLSQ